MPKRASDSATEMVQVVLPNDANPLGFILGGTVMHLIDIAGAIACHRHTRTLLVTAAVDGLQFLHPIKVGDLIILKSRVTAAWTTSLEVEVEVFSEEILTGLRKLTSVAYLTFVAIDNHDEPDSDSGVDPGDRGREAQGRRGGSAKSRAAQGAQGPRSTQHLAWLAVTRRRLNHEDLEGHKAHEGLFASRAKRGWRCHETGDARRCLGSVSHLPSRATSRRPTSGRPREQPHRSYLATSARTFVILVPS